MKEREFTFEEEQQMLYERMQAESPHKLTEEEKGAAENRKEIEEYIKKMDEEEQKQKQKQKHN